MGHQMKINKGEVLSYIGWPKCHSCNQKDLQMAKRFYHCEECPYDLCEACVLIKSKILSEHHQYTISHPCEMRFEKGDSQTKWQCHFEKQHIVPTYMKNRCKDIAYWRPQNGVWYIKGQGVKDWDDEDGKNIQIQCGMEGDIPVQGDYFGEGEARIAAWRPSSGTWFIKSRGNGNWADA